VLDHLSSKPHATQLPFHHQFTSGEESSSSPLLQTALELAVCELPAKVAVAGDHHSFPALALWNPLCHLSLTRPFFSSRNAARRRHDEQQIPPSPSIAGEEVSVLADTTSTGSPILSLI
jgi:hypothetical protein